MLVLGVQFHMCEVFTLRAFYGVCFYVHLVEFHHIMLRMLLPCWGGGWLIVDAWYGCVHGFQVCRSILTIRVIMGCTASCWVGWSGLCVCLCWE